MASRCLPDPPPAANDFLQVEPVVSQAVSDPIHMEYDFLEEPSQDFFCPVTLELLFNPHQTACCGNHLSQEAVTRLQRDGKPCPMCKKPQLATTEDKFYQRKVNEIKVRCPHKKSGCEWVGEVNDVKQHSESCPKRPWQCWHCGFESTCDIGLHEHLPNCPIGPVECPNSCEVGSVARCDLEAHLMECPLQLVTCEYTEVGCDVKVPRRDLDRHMKEGQQQHLLSATLLNLRLTRENTEERNRLLRIIEEKEEEYKKELAVKDGTIADLQKQLKLVQDGLTKQKLERERLCQVLAEKDKENEGLQAQLRMKDEAIEEKAKEIVCTDQSLAEKNQQLLEKDNEIRCKIQTVEEISAAHALRLAMRDQVIEEKYKIIADLQKKVIQAQEMVLKSRTREKKRVIKQLEQKDEAITDLQTQVEQVQDGLEAMILELQQQVVKCREDTLEQVKLSMFHRHVQFNETYIRQGFSVHDFTLCKFKECQAETVAGDWYSEPFYSHPGGYKFTLNICTNGEGDDRGVCLTVWFQLLAGDHDDKLEWPVTMTAHVQLLNQLGDHSHHEKTSTGEWSDTDWGEHLGGICRFIKLTKLGLNAQKCSQYLKNDCLFLRVYTKIESAQCNVD